MFGAFLRQLGEFRNQVDGQIVDRIVAQILQRLEHGAFAGPAQPGDDHQLGLVRIRARGARARTGAGVCLAWSTFEMCSRIRSGRSARRAGDQHGETFAVAVAFGIPIHQVIAILSISSSASSSVMGLRAHDDSREKSCFVGRSAGAPTGSVRCRSLRHPGLRGLVRRRLVSRHLARCFTAWVVQLLERESRAR